MATRSKATAPYIFRCTCKNCQIMDREEECICCQEIQVVLDNNEEVYEVERPQKRYYCITDNPGFPAVCLNRQSLQAAWFQYKQQNGQRQLRDQNIKSEDTWLTDSQFVGVGVLLGKRYESFCHRVLSVAYEPISLHLVKKKTLYSLDFILQMNNERNVMLLLEKTTLFLNNQFVYLLFINGENQGEKRYNVVCPKQRKNWVAKPMSSLYNTIT